MRERECLPCRTVTHAEHKDSNDQELVKVFQNGEDNLEDIRAAIRGILWEGKRVGEDVECEVDVALKRCVANERHQYLQ
jgi:hypothetical protein